MADSGSTTQGTEVTVTVEQQAVVPPTVGVPQTPPDRPPLAFTGFDLVTALVLAALLLALGSLALVLARRPGTLTSGRTTA